MVKNFRHEDGAYRTWLGEHPHGFVLNTRARPDPAYMVLHAARCPTISAPSVAPGAYTARAYRKVCAATVEELSRWVSFQGRPDGSFSKICGRCLKHGKAGGHPLPHRQ